MYTNKKKTPLKHAMWKKKQNRNFGSLGQIRIGYLFVQISLKNNSYSKSINQLKIFDQKLIFALGIEFKFKGFVYNATNL